MLADVGEKIEVANCGQNLGPDEEGIETRRLRQLRRRSIRQNLGPDEEGIETLQFHLLLWR